MKHTLLFLLLILIGSCKVNQEIATSPAPTIAPQEQAPPAAAKPKAKSKAKKTWETDLKDSFRAHYKTMVQKQQVKISQNYPVIMQDFLNMTLIRSNGKRVRFRMKKKAYHTLAHTTHPPTSVYLILSASNFKIDNDSTIQELMNYDTIVQKSIIGIKSVQHLEKAQIDNTSKMLVLTHEYIQKIVQQRNTSKEAFQDFAVTVRPMTNQNLKDGAVEHLNQFKEQMKVWKTTFPNENWSELRVAILGFHQPRILNVPNQFFQWLLKEPEFEKRVVYVEFQFSIFRKNRPEAERLALELITKVDLDKAVAYTLLGNETFLQQDVMAPMAKEIISNWGDSNWYNQEN